MALELNAQQQAAANCLEGPVLVLAGAGSGKTRVLTERIANLVDSGVNPYSVLAITFTNKAANEMRERLYARTPQAGRMTISTIHSMCALILRMDGEQLGYRRNFSIYSDNDSERVLKRLFKELGFDDEKLLKRAPYHISACKNSGISAEEYEKDYLGASDDGEKLYKIMTEYNKRLFESNAMDFDDLLFNVYRLFREFPETLEKYQRRYSYVSIDEFQDTNRVQYEIFKMLAASHRNIFVVGDDDQSIYGWRGADANNLFKFRTDFPDAEVFKLEQNYRSTKKILDAANKIISLNENRFQKTLWTQNEDGVRVETYTAYSENEEAAYVVQQISNLVSFGKYTYSDFAVLMRINALSRVFEQEFLKYGLPFKVFGGFKFFERKEIKDTAAYLRILDNESDDEALFRIINTPRRGIGDTTVERLKRFASVNNISMLEALRRADSAADISSAAKIKLREFAGLLDELKRMSMEMPLDRFVRSMVEFTHLRACEEKTEAEINRVLNIDEFVSAVEEFCKDNPQAGISEFLQSVSLQSDLDKLNASDNCVSLATVHAAKGLEFKVVFVIGLEDGIFPISRAVFEADEMAEERRLMYVAVTRACNRLYLTRARSRFLNGSRKETYPSRFLREVEEFVRPEKAEERKSDENGGYITNRHGAAPLRTPLSGEQIGKFKVGMKVNHKIYGRGIILDVKDGNADVAFDAVGKKTLSLKIAPLEIL